ncbi:DNA cytosine methyltransferase [Clostridioides sp. ZZV14-6345]|uniref:DNA cytosine methyltransferase n=1 Tax=Clostridioides sp. ZZV14-6345 TaxID=2811496 RepID=UPI001D1289ED|nr:DNA cytosine methyltransferase [Clostridioides sp. ZZV14-6345]
MKIAVDLFCGAGGMSEGILQAGFHIAFSSDKSSEVALTYKNRHKQLGLIQGKNTWFEQMDIRDLSGDFILKKIKSLDMFKNGRQGKARRKRFKKNNPIDAIFGGPPCQGFSRSGKRDPNDPRNFLFREYLRIIDELKPRYVVMENVEGMLDMKLYIEGLRGTNYENVVVPEILKSEFKALGYKTLDPRLMDASDYGVPQSRKRVIFIAYLEEEREPKYPTPTHIGEDKVTILQAIGDLIKDRDLRENLNPQFTEYQNASILGRTRRLDGSRLQVEGILNSELSNHTNIVKERFSLYREGEDANSLRKRIKLEGIDISDKLNLIKYIEKEMEKLAVNTEIDISPEIAMAIDEVLNDRDYIINSLKNPNCIDELIDALLTKKNSRTRLNRNEPSLTVLTIPDDYISPFENRTFTVRELARLQSFDDSFEFLGKRTTGGQRRKEEVPQYTQVGNAVPPLLARAIASEINKSISAKNKHKRRKF